MNESGTPLIGPLLKAERKKSGLTLEQLGAQSGVSKSMLSQIERGETNPTFAVLWSLTKALGVNFAELMSDANRHRSNLIELVNQSHTPAISSPDGDWILRILSPPELAGRTEWYEVEIAAERKLASAPHAAGTIEHLTAMTDGLCVVSGEQKQRLAMGETARYHADIAHRIINESAQPARALMVVIFR